MATTPPAPRRDVVWPMTLLAVVVTIAATVLILENKDLGTLIGLLAIVVVPVLGVFIAQVHAGLSEVKAQVNGRMSEAQGAFISMAQQATQQPVTVPVVMPPPPDPGLSP